jgi:hypothetical protein
MLLQTVCNERMIKKPPPPLYRIYQQYCGQEQHHFRIESKEVFCLRKKMVVPGSYSFHQRKEHCIKRKQTKLLRLSPSLFVTLHLQATYPTQSIARFSLYA